MKFTIVALAAAVGLTNAQLTFDNGNFVCSGQAAAKNQTFCAGESLQTNIIIRCSGTKGQPGNCNDNLAGVPPVGVKFAQCYQTSNTTGDAACSYNGIAYPDNGDSFPIPGASSSATAIPQSTSTVVKVSTSSAQGYVSASASATSTGSASVHTVHSTTTISTCSTTAYAPVGTGGMPAPSGNGTTFTTGYPQPTIVNAAGAVGVQSGLIAGVMAFVGAMLL